VVLPLPAIPITIQTTGNFFLLVFSGSVGLFGCICFFCLDVFCFVFGFVVEGLSEDGAAVCEDVCIDGPCCCCCFCCVGCVVDNCDDAVVFCLCKDVVEVCVCDCVCVCVCGEESWTVCAPDFLLSCPCTCSFFTVDC